jgi:hypothetical protein
MGKNEQLTKIKKDKEDDIAYIMIKGKKVPYRRYLKEVKKKGTTATPVLINLLMIVAIIFLALLLTGWISLNFFFG